MEKFLKQVNAAKDAVNGPTVVPTPEVKALRSLIAACETLAEELGGKPEEPKK